MRGGRGHGDGRGHGGGRGHGRQPSASTAAGADHAEGVGMADNHPFRVIPGNAREVYIWAVRCILRMLNSIRREDRVAMRTECERVISAIDATEVKPLPFHQFETLLSVCVCVCCVTRTGGTRYCRS